MRAWHTTIMKPHTAFAVEISLSLSLLLHCKYSHIFRGKNSFFLDFANSFIFYATTWNTQPKSVELVGEKCMHTSSSQVGFIWKKTTKTRNHEPFRFVLCICLCHSFCRLFISLSCSYTLVFVLSERLAYHLKYIWEFTNALPYGCSNLCIEFFFRLQLSLTPIPWADARANAR